MMFSGLGVLGCVIVVLLGVGHTKVRCSLHFEKLKIFAIVYDEIKEVFVMRDETYTYLWIHTGI